MLIASGGNLEFERRFISIDLEKSSFEDRSMDPEGDRVELSGTGNDYRS